MALTKLNNNGIAGVTALPSSVALGDMVLVSSATASSSATIDFTLGDYKEYQFYLVNIHPATDNVDFTMNFSTDNGSNYNVTKTDTYFAALHTEAGNDSGLQYEAAEDLAQGTGFTVITKEQANDNDSGAVSIINIFNPSSTTFVKHYIMRSGWFQHNDYAQDAYKAGYANTTSALTNIRFKFASGNIDSGQILCYGIN